MEKIGRVDNRPLLSQLSTEPKKHKVVILRGGSEGYSTYEDALIRGSKASANKLYKAESKVLPHLVCNLQFTSGTTGHPKAAMLTHQ